MDKKKSIQDAWDDAFRKALKQYGHRSQAERIAWAAIDGMTTEALTRLRQRPRLKRIQRKRAA